MIDTKKSPVAGQPDQSIQPIESHVPTTSQVPTQDQSSTTITQTIDRPDTSRSSSALATPITPSIMITESGRPTSTASAPRNQTNGQQISPLQDNDAYSDSQSGEPLIETSIRDYAYPESHPLHYGPMYDNDEYPYYNDAPDERGLPRSFVFGDDGPPWKEDADLVSPVITAHEIGDRISKEYAFSVASADEIHGRAVALFDFKPENDNEVALKEGQIIWVSYRHGRGWLVAEDPTTGETGLVPEEYVQLVSSYRHSEESPKQQTINNERINEPLTSDNEGENYPNNNHSSKSKIDIEEDDIPVRLIPDLLPGNKSKTHNDDTIRLSSSNDNDGWIDEGPVSDDEVTQVANIINTTKLQ